MIKSKLSSVITSVLVTAVCALMLISPSSSIAQRRARQPRGLAVCGDPTARCNTSYNFPAHNLPFRLPARSVIYETEMFYAVIIRSVRTRGGVDGDCAQSIEERERLEAQSLFPTRKVFASRCYEAGELYYTNVAPNTQFMAVYAGRTQSEAARLLEDVRATGRFPGASVRRMRAGFNGT